MADNKTEIERLKREIQRVNGEIGQLERSYEAKLKQEITRIKSDFAQSAAAQQQDFTERFKKLEKSVSDAYLAQVKEMQARYQRLTDEVAAYEAQLDAQIQELVREKEKFLREKAEKEAKTTALAEQALQKLQQSIQDACQYPVDLFYPRALQRYMDAGKEAESLLQNQLASLALAKADCACMSVDRLADDTAAKVRELDAMFDIYRAKLEAIQTSLTAEPQRMTDNGEVVLELSEIDLDYWSDLLYSDLQALLSKHQEIIDAGVDGWLAACQQTELSPSLQLDKKMQELDLIPRKLNICVSYALSACDCYNFFSRIQSMADDILGNQNYSFCAAVYGRAKEENSTTNGYQHYYDAGLAEEQCVEPGEKPDYREERILRYQKHYANEKIEQCSLIVVPLRTKETVSFQTYLRLESEYLPMVVAEQLRTLFQQAGLPVQLLARTACVPVQSDRLFSLETLNQMIPEDKKSTLAAKYSLNI